MCNYNFCCEELAIIDVLYVCVCFLCVCVFRIMLISVYGCKCALGPVCACVLISVVKRPLFLTKAIKCSSSIVR
jgi:hypothetical protein